MRDASIPELPLVKIMADIEAEGEPIGDPEAITDAKVDGGPDADGVAFFVGVIAAVLLVAKADDPATELKKDLPVTEPREAFEIEFAVDGGPEEIEVSVEDLLFVEFDANEMGVAAEVIDEAIFDGTGVAIGSCAKGRIVTKGGLDPEAFGDVVGEATFHGEVGEVGVVGDPTKVGREFDATFFEVCFFLKDGKLIAYLSMEKRGKKKEERERKGREDAV